MSLAARTLSRWRMDRLTEFAPNLIRFLLFAAIGIEIMVLSTWLPDTLQVWWAPAEGDVADFRYFYDHAQSSSTVGFYNPGLTFLMQPLTALKIESAFQVYFAINVAALMGVAYLAQRGVRSREAKVVVFLAVIALPQAHWALRVGHFVPVLTLLALGGFLLAERRPLLAGVLFGLLVLKPQYLPVPILYLLWTHNWRALLGAAGTLGVLSGVGVAVVGIAPFVNQLDKMASIGLDHSAIYVPVQQAWQYSWQGFLISAGVDPNPLIVIDLLILSALAILFVWVVATPPVAKVAAALGMLLLAPYATFYNWSLIAVAGALLLRSDIRPKALVPLLLGLGVIAAAATQKATPYPAFDLLGDGGTYGLYWIQPFALVALFALALAGRRRLKSRKQEQDTVAKRTVRVVHSSRQMKQPKWTTQKVPGYALAAAAALGALSLGYVVSAFVSESGPFQPDPFGRQAVLRILPSDFPLLGAASLEDAGRGTLLPYRVVWQTEQPISEVAGLLRRQLDDGAWEVMLVDEEGESVIFRTAHVDDDGDMDLFAELEVTSSGDGSLVNLEFTPLPIQQVPDYEEWLIEIEPTE